MGAITPESPSTSVAGVVLEHPVLNAAGTARSVDDVRRLARATVAAVTIGSFTVDARLGNPGEVFAPHEDFALNALGLPNRGLDGLRRELPGMVELAHAAGKPLVVSVAGFAPEEYGELAAGAVAGGADLVELNLGCPNVWTDGSQHRIASFDPDLVARSTAAAVAVGARVGVKLSPLSDPVLLREVADALSGAGARFVVSSNTFPNGLDLGSDGHPSLDLGYGGVSGPALRPIALGQIAQLRRALPEEIDLIGVGGVRHGRDVGALLCAGASAVAAATVFWARGEDPRVYGDLVAGWTS